jgi:hypothetical protein
MPPWRARHPPSSDDARAEHHRLDLRLCEHQWRQVEATAQHVADAGFALDWHAGQRQVADVAIDGALGHFELARQPRRGDDAAAAQQLDDLEEPISASHFLSDGPGEE